MLRFAGKILLFALAAGMAQLLIALDWSWNAEGRPGLSVRWPSESYRPDSQVVAFQKLMKTHPRLGFTFRENLGQDGPLELRWADQDVGTLITDEHGFANSPYALEARRQGRRIQVVGVGSSFMQGAASKLHDFFWAKGIFYYSMASPRHTFPQFHAALEEYALAEKPEWILYDLNEVGFELIPDYESWSRSGWDWFSYHSGTWCGPARKATPRWLAERPRAEALYRKVRRQIYPEPPLAGVREEELVEKAFAHISAAHAAAGERGVRFLVLAIPSKEAAVYGDFRGWKRVAALIPRLEKSGIEVLNLQPVFADEPDPRELYYRVDAHWNDHGIFRAAQAVAGRLADRLARRRD